MVGLYFAGNSDGTIGVANPIAAVESELGVTVYTCPPLKFKEVKEFKDVKEWKEIKEWKEKDFKEWKELKELKEKDKDKDIFEGPFDPGPVSPDPFDQSQSNRTGGRGAEARLASLEQAVDSLRHFISAGLRPEMSGSPLNREAGIDQARLAQVQRELYSQEAAAKATKDLADTPGYR